MGADCSPPSRQARGPRTTGGRQPGLIEGNAFDALLGDKDGRTADADSVNPGSNPGPPANVINELKKVGSAPRRAGYHGATRSRDSEA
jgi:hypothetical protein